MFGELIEELVGSTNAQLDDRLRSLELQRLAIDAEIAATVAVASQRMVHLDDGHRSTKGWLRATCNWSHAEVNRVTRSARLVDGVADVGELWLRGHIGSSQVNELATAFSHPRVGPQLAEFAPLLLEHAEHLPFDDFRACVQRFVVLADLDGAHRDADAVEADRTARVTAHGSGVDISATGGNALTTAEFVAVVEQFVEAEFANDVAARRAEFGDAADQHPLPRTSAQRRHDALHSIFMAAVSVPAHAKTPSPIVDIVVDERTAAQTLARHGLAPADMAGFDTAGFGLADLFGETGAAVSSVLLADAADLLGRRCETSTGIVVHPDLMLRAALAGHVRRVVVDASGVVIDMGWAQRLFTGSARTAAQLLAQRCSHPGCVIPATVCDVDHMQPWVEGGRTDQHNADARCGPQDRHKHRARWETRRATSARVYTIRGDGTVILPVGERCPEFFDPDDDPVEIARQVRLTKARCAALRPASTD